MWSKQFRIILVKIYQSEKTPMWIVYYYYFMDLTTEKKTHVHTQRINQYSLYSTGASCSIKKKEIFKMVINF